MVKLLGTGIPSVVAQAARALLLVAAIATTLPACTDFVERTRVLVVIDAQESLHERIRYVEIEVRSGSEDANFWDLKDTQKLFPRGGSKGWPMHFTIPRDVDDTSDGYFVTATAKDADDNTLTVVRAHSKFVKGKTLELQLSFDEACVLREKMCGDTFSCKNGVCIDPLVDEAKLPTLTEPEVKNPVASTATMSQTAAGSTAEPQAGSDAPGCAGACAATAGCSAGDKDCNNASKPKPATPCPARDGAGACLPCPVGFLGSSAADCSPSLTMLEVPAGALSPAFAPEQTDYVVDVPLLAERLDVTLATVSSVEVRINGVALDGKTTWTTPALGIGASKAVITLQASGFASRTYTLELKRNAVQSQQLQATPTSPGDSFGQSIAISGDRMLIGAPFEDGSTRDPAGDPDDARKDSGAAYLYERTATGWMPKAYLKAEVPVANAHFGYTVAIDGERFAISAPEDPSGGVVYLFELQNGVPVQVKTFQAKAAKTWFGRGLALQKDRLAIGVASDSTDVQEGGSVMVYERDASGWQLRAELRAMTPGPLDWLGSSVAMDGDLIVSGATGAALTGVVYVFERSAQGWNQVAMLNPTTETSALVGESVAISGTTIATGGFYGSAGLSAGRAYVFTRGEDGKFKQESLQPNNSHDGDWFGERVALSGELLLVSASHEASAAGGVGADGSGKLQQSGAVYLFSHAGGSWQQQLMIKSSRPAVNESLGVGLAASNREFVVGGVTGENRDGTSTKPGSVYVFH